MVLSRFGIDFHEDAREFLYRVEIKTRFKILFNTDKARITNDPVLYKKPDTEVGEFRTYCPRVR